MPAQASGHIKKHLRKRKIKKASVLRVLAAVMENQAVATAAAAASNGAGSEVSSSDFHNEFYSSGRIGRRNALPDILGYNCATTTTADLPLRLSALTTNDTPSTSSMANSAGTSSASVTDSSMVTASTSASCISSTHPVGETMNTT